MIPDQFVTSETIKKISAALYADENIFCFNEDSSDAVFNCNQIGINNNNFDNNFDEDDPDTIILIRLLAWYIKF